LYNKDKATLKNDILKKYENIFEEALIDEIVDVGYFDKIKKGKLLIDIGDYLTHIPLILTGVIKIMRQEGNGDELALYFLEPGDTCAISFANCLNRKQSIFKGIVEVNVEAVFIPVEVIDNWLAKYKTWRHFIIDSYHFRLLEMVESIDSLAFMKMKERIWKYLSDRVKVSNDYDLEITHQEIAFDLNSSRVVISRIVKILHEEGKIFSTRSKVKLIELY
jgi:CRP/FNR family transcriptional regulator